MNKSGKKALLLVPFWRMAGHVGNNRIDRFKRWLSEDGYELVIVRAGTKEAVRRESWGQEITVVDRLGLHPESEPGEAKTVSKRKPNRLRRSLALWVFNPDPAVVWAKAAARNAKVITSTQGAEFILSSSPPESAHVGAWLLSKRTGVPHIMDMRDGWLDEPLKPLLHTSALRRWLERRLESRIIQDAKVIQVSSEAWKNMIDDRYPELAHKVHVLTNGYPKNMVKRNPRRLKKVDAELIFIHAGRFMGSHINREPEFLLGPLIENLNDTQYKGVIRFYGDLSDQEVARIQCFGSRFNSIGWRLEFPGNIPREEMLVVMQEADCLLLPSASRAALPSKMFEYLATGLPIGYVAAPDSATEKVLREISSAINLRTDSLHGMLDPNSSKSYIAPICYSEQELKKIFRLIINW